VGATGAFTSTGIFHLEMDIEANHYPMNRAAEILAAFNQEEVIASAYQKQAIMKDRGRHLLG
jgi:hypothetical protein